MLASTSPRVSVRKTNSTLRKERDRSTLQGSVSSLPPYSELYSPISSKGARLGLGILEREESDGEEEEDHQEEEEEEREGRAHRPPPGGSSTTPTRSSTLPATTHVLLSSPSPSTQSFNLTPSRSTNYTSYHLTSPRPQPPLAINTSSSSLLPSSSTASLLEESSSDEGSFESPVTQLDRLLLRSSSALATAQTLLSGTLTARGSLLDLDERGREGDDSLSRIDVETRLRTRRDSELYPTRIDPLFNSISLLLSDLERQTPYVSSYASHPLRTRLSAVGTSLGSVQQVDASYIPSSNSSHQRSISHIHLPSSPNGGPDDTSSVQPPQSPATSLLHSLHGRTSSVSSGKSFFLSPPPSSPISRFAFPTPASSPPTQTRFPSTTSTSSSTSTSKDRTPNALSRDRTPTTSTTTFSSPPQPKSSHPTPSLHPSPSLDRMLSSSSSTANSDISTSPTRSRTVSTSAALVGGSSSNRDSANVNSLTLQIPFSSSDSSTSSSSRHPSPSEADKDALLTSLPTPSLSGGPIRHRQSQSPLPHSSTRSTPPSAFRTSASPSPTPVSATTTPTMSTVSLPSTNSTSTSSPVGGGGEKKSGQVGSAVLGNESVAMARLRSLGALKPAAAPALEGSSSSSSEGPPPAGSDSGATTKKWGVPGWFGS